MSPDTFHDLLDRETAAPPPAPGPGRELAEGRRRLRRRRVAAASTVVAVVAVIGGVTVAVTTPGHDRAQDPVAPSPQVDDQAALLDSCRNGPQEERATDALFRSGTPLVKSAVRTDFQTVLALESPDGDYWAECTVSLLPAEFPASMSVYPSDPTQTPPGVHETYRGYGFGTGCGLIDGEPQPDCPTWILDRVDRLPDAVAAVRFDLADGTTETVQSTDGYVVLNILHERTDAIPLDPTGLLDVADPILRTYYLGADGNPIAAEDYTSAELEHGQPQPVDGLPLLSAYPPLRGAEI